MRQVTLTDAELVLLGKLFEDLKFQYETCGCNEMDLPATPGGMKALIEAIEAKWYDEAQVPEKYRMPVRVVDSETIRTSDFMVLDYLKQRIGV